ncbi:glycerophosphodiester phosphodiesterase family protein [Erythrobacter sp. HL-111]|uniref:glycerophosphodiester phosphodiesterase family protein n=1 Tax=Erythrobacter sp. HL-111 TaxID=1798193 RepID=UPI0006DA6C07|nr:glycerophosphodiester phosphodiesterase family protein [Erythrobacter sp. HL-111]KPP95090.1 MAG: glycerophosphoryl diester phosphodiesterase [Erythrobacteraceae bacterium HL-111]SDS07520.1 glycerophosphoryl diester phosphodiesterase [Erythrobacter sp. HL-111]
MMARLAAAAAVLGLAGFAASESSAREQWRLVPESSLSAMLDCLEAEGRTLVSAHRGGPSPGLPENAIPTMDAVLTAIPAVMEVDVAQSADGVLFLMHDDTLDRTTTGEGRAADKAWADLAALRLTDSAGWVTPYAIPTLAEALDWAKGRTVLQLDFKRSASYEDVIEMVREKGMEEGVILIAYSIPSAKKLHRLAPSAMISLSIESPDALEEAVAAGIPAERIIAFTGTRLARPDLYAALDEADVEVIFGTLGRSPNSIDNVIDRFGTDERYAELSQGGVDMLATDRPREAAAALAEAERLPEAGMCGVGRGD